MTSSDLDGVRCEDVAQQMRRDGYRLAIARVENHSVQEEAQADAERVIRECPAIMLEEIRPGREAVAPTMVWVVRHVRQSLARREFVMVPDQPVHDLGY